MRKLTLIVVATLLCAMAAVAVWANATTETYTTAQNKNELLAGVTGKKWVVKSLLITTDAANTVYLSDGATKVGSTFYLGDKGGVVLNNTDIRETLVFEPGAGIDFNSSVATNATVTIEAELR